LIWITLGYKRRKLILSISAQIYPSYNTAVLRTSTQRWLLGTPLLAHFMAICQRATSKKQAAAAKDSRKFAGV